MPATTLAPRSAKKASREMSPASPVATVTTGNTARTKLAATREVFIGGTKGRVEGEAPAYSRLRPLTRNPPRKNDHPIGKNSAVPKFTGARRAAQRDGTSLPAVDS